MGFHKNCESCTKSSAFEYFHVSGARDIENKNIASAMADSEVLLAQLGPGIIEDTRYIPTKSNSRARNLQHGMISAVLFPSHAFSCCGLCSHLPMV